MSRVPDSGAARRVLMLLAAAGAVALAAPPVRAQAEAAAPAHALPG